MKKAYSKSEMLKLTKGFHNGLCNRQACLSPIDVVYFNHSTRKFYCKKCAVLLNNVNDDLEAEFGHPLCRKMAICDSCNGSGEAKGGGACCMCDGEGYLND